MPKLREHQQKVLPKMHNGCILWGGVGSGKSMTALAYYVAKESPKQIIVITTAKKRDSKDWEREAAQWTIGKTPDATAHGTLIVDSWNNLHKYIALRGCFFIFDEQRLVGDGKWVKNFLKIAKANHWIMLSATPGDTWMDYVPVFIANGFYRNRTHFKSEHVIYKPFMNYPVISRYVNVQRLVKYRHQILVKMPYEYETKRHPINVWCDYDLGKLSEVTKARWNPYTNEPIKNSAEFFMVMRKVVNSDPSRGKHLLEILKKHKRVILFYNFNYELDLIRALQPRLEQDSTALAEWNGQKHEEIPDSERWLYVVQYLAGAEGWECTTTDTMAFWSLTYSYKLWHQAHGRIDRLNTLHRDLYYYALRSKAPIDSAVWAALKKKQNFNEHKHGSVFLPAGVFPDENKPKNG